MKNKKIIKILVPIIIIIVILITVFLKYINTYSFTMYLNWGLKLPSKANCSLMYEKDSGENFFGDGERYHIYSYENQEYISDMLKWLNKEDSATFIKDQNEEFTYFFDEVKVPDNLKPNYNNCLLWHKTQDESDSIFILWDKDSKKIYIFEFFI